MFRWTLTNPTSGSSVLTADPYGWEDADFIIRRDAKYHGLFNSFSLSLDFHCNAGKDFIDEVYDREGIDGNVTILIEFECSDGSGFSTLYDGKLNFGTYEDTLLNGEPITRLNIEQNDVTQLVKTRDNIPIDLATITSLDGNSIGASYTYQDYALNLHSQKIFLESQLDYSSYPQTESTTNVLQNTNTYGCYLTHPYPLAKSGLKQTTLNPETIDLRTGGSFSIGVSSIGHFHQATFNTVVSYPATYDFTYSFAGTYKDIEGTGQTRVLAGTWSLLLYAGPDLATGVQRGAFVNLGSIAGYSTSATTYTSPAFNFSGTTTITLYYGDKLWLAWGMTGGSGYTITTGPFTGNVTWQWDYTDADALFELNSSFPESTCQAYAIHEAWARVAEAITDQSDALRSTLFGRTNSQPHSYASNGCDSFTAITSGLAIRGFSAADKPVTISLKDIFDACNAIWNIGLGIESGGSGHVLRVEKKSYFYDTTTLLTLSNVDNVQMRVDESYYFNSAFVGFKKWEIDEVEGLDEISASHEWAVPIKATQQEYESVSDFVAAGYALEISRRFGSRKENTTDYKFDNEMFVICLKRGLDGSGNPNELDDTEQDENFSAVNGIQNSDTRYNLRISPKRNLLRQLYSINAGLTKKPGENILFQTGDANFDMDSTMTANSCDGDYTGNNLTEGADIAWDDANIRTHDPVWLPEIYEFDYSISHSEFNTILTNPERAIQFSDSTTGYKKGFILEMSYNIATGQTHFVLLRANV